MMTKSAISRELEHKVIYHISQHLRRARRANRPLITISAMTLAALVGSLLGAEVVGASDNVSTIVAVSDWEERLTPEEFLLAASHIFTPTTDQVNESVSMLPSRDGTTVARAVLGYDTSVWIFEAATIGDGVKLTITSVDLTTGAIVEQGSGYTMAAEDGRTKAIATMADNPYPTVTEASLDVGPECTACTGIALVGGTILTSPCTALIVCFPLSVGVGVVGDAICDTTACAHSDFGKPSIAVGVYCGFATHCNLMIDARDRKVGAPSGLTSQIYWCCYGQTFNSEVQSWSLTPTEVLSYPASKKIRLYDHRHGGSGVCREQLAGTIYFGAKWSDGMSVSVAWPTAVPKPTSTSC